MSTWKWKLAAIGLAVTSAAAQAEQYFVRIDGNDANSGLDWSLAFKTLDRALTAAGAAGADVIWVAQGSYTSTTLDGGTTNRHRTFLVPTATQVFGGFLGPSAQFPNGETELTQRNTEVNLTVLTGDLNGDDDYGTFPYNDTFGDNSYHVVTLRGVAATTKVSGFVIRGGYADGPSDPAGNWIGDDYGAGIFVAYIDNGAHSGALLNRNVVEYNFAWKGGAGIYISGKEPSYVTNCTMRRNHVKEGFGAGLLVNFGHFSGSVPVALQNCVFADNHIEQGTGAGLAVPNVQSRGSEIVNCTFYHNTCDEPPADPFADSLAGAVYCRPNGGGEPQNATAIIRNCIVWDNTSPQLGGMIDACYSDVEDGSWYDDDPGNPTPTCPGTSITTDPLFRDAGNRILRVRHCSPVLDLGFDPMILTDGTDVNDNGTIEPITPWDRDKEGARVLNVGASVPQRTVDMGAWEESIAGDIDGNGVVDISDLTQLLSCFGTPDCTTAPPCCIADITGGGALC